MPTTPTVVNNAAFWEWLRNKVRKDNKDHDIKNVPVSLELPVDDPSLVQEPVSPTTQDSDDKNSTEVDHVVYQF